MRYGDCEPEAREALGQTKDGTIKYANNDLLTSRKNAMSHQTILPAHKITGVLAWMDDMPEVQLLLIILFHCSRHFSNILS